MHVFEQTAPAMKLIKAELKETWISGDFTRIAEITASESEGFIVRLNLQPGTKVLDIACGTGNLSIPAARAGAKVTGIDIAPNLLDEARSRAAAENLEIKFDEGDAERLPYEDNSFDVIISMFGAMFAPRTDRVITELFRVCRAGGVIAMANWTPSGFVGQLHKIAGSYLPRAENSLLPFLWGDVAGLASLFGEAVTDLQCRRRIATLNFPCGVREAVEHWRAYYGPTRSVFETIDETEQKNLRQDLEWLFSSKDVSANGGTAIEAEYMEALATLKA
jgi:SAM-dependent methyltransferase